MNSPFTYHEMHPNSLAAFSNLELSLRQQIVYDTFIRAEKSQTDRQILYRLIKSYEGDMNKVRPRITEMIKMGVLIEIGKTECSYTKQRVRVCMIPIMHEGEQEAIKFD